MTPSKNKAREWYEGHYRTESSGCILWIGATNPYGYGQTSMKGMERLVHRRAFAEAYGPIPYGKCVLHKCDVPNCFNVDHLFIGTKRDNRLDQIAKHRDPAKEATLCKRGHEIGGSVNRSIGRRYCYKCHLWRKREFYSRGLLIREVLPKRKVNKA